MINGWVILTMLISFDKIGVKYLHSLRVTHNET